MTIEVEIDEALLAQARLVLEPMGLTPEDALRMFIEFCGDPKNEEAVKEMVNRWIEDETDKCLNFLKNEKKSGKSKSSML